MERVISYDELPSGRGKSVYLRMESDPKLYLKLFEKGYKIVSHINDCSKRTIFLTGARQVYNCTSFREHKKNVDKKIEDSLLEYDITKPITYKFSYTDLIEYKYNLPFVFKNESVNGGKEKFLIETEEDYEILVCACDFLINKNLFGSITNDYRDNIDYYSYLENNFYIQEYIDTPTDYNTTVRVLTSPSNDLLYAALKYKEKDKYIDHTTYLGYLLSEIFPLSSKSIVSNTISGGENILIGDNFYLPYEKEILDSHNFDSSKFRDVLEGAITSHSNCEEYLGSICGFDFIYDKDKDKWNLLEYHSKPMVGDYVTRQGIKYKTKEDRIVADGRVRATSLNLQLKR